MQLTIDTANESFGTALATLCSAYGVDLQDYLKQAQESTQRPALSAPTTEDGFPDGWDEARLRRWASFLTEDARVCTAYIAAHAPAVPFDDVIEHLSRKLGRTVDGQYVGGVMSSGGFAARDVQGSGYTVPIERNYGRREYRIDVGVAAILADELG